MSYPTLEIDLKKITENTQFEVEYFKKHSIEIMGVNKVFSGMMETAESVFQGGINILAESVLANLKKIKDLPCKKALIRSPGLSEVKEAVEHADIMTVVEAATILAISKEATRQKKTVELLLMIDVGDLREGLWFEEYDEIKSTVELILSLQGVELYGIGTNYGCYGTIIPTRDSSLALISIVEKLEEELKIEIGCISGGNCSSFNMVDRGLMPKRINQLRIGGQHLFGIEYVEGRYLEGYHHSNMDIQKYVSDCYIFKAEIIELRDKPTVPIGPLGVDAFMKTKTFEDKGVRRQGILNFGLQEIPFGNIHPVDERIVLLGQTSNHTILDMEDAKENYSLGDIISFEVDYTGLMFLCNTPHIQTNFIR